MLNFSLHKSVFAFSILMIAFTLNAQKKLPKLQQGDWTGKLQLNTSNVLPFQFSLQGQKRNYTLQVINGEDTISLINGRIVDDSIRFQFPDFNSELIFKKKGKGLLKGFWHNYNKGTNYKIPFEASAGFTSRIPWCMSSEDGTIPLVDGKWQVTFDPNTDNSYFSIGNFKQSGDAISGTFLTETGDYGFLEGNISNDSLYLSGFDGSKAYLFKSKITNDSLSGRFLSGVHFDGEWSAVRNENFSLSHPDSLTVLVSDFKFSATTLDKKEFHYPNDAYKNKVVIVQIMGSWCANCMDETRLFKELYEKYHPDGLEIIAVAYEIGTTLDQYLAAAQRMKERHQINFELLVGGSVKEGRANVDFQSLNKIVSFPTSIFIDKKGEVRKIHTGFSGPGTGEYYTAFVTEINNFIKELLAE
ncbi:MAG: TlpA disulfide reductase family protein [Bacteroidota bacterium]